MPKYITDDVESFSDDENCVEENSNKENSEEDFYSEEQFQECIFWESNLGVFFFEKVLFEGAVLKKCLLRIFFEEAILKMLLFE